MESIHEKQLEFQRRRVIQFTERSAGRFIRKTRLESTSTETEESTERKRSADCPSFLFESPGKEIPRLIRRKDTYERSRLMKPHEARGRAPLCPGGSRYEPARVSPVSPVESQPHSAPRAVLFSQRITRVILKTD